MDGRPQVRHAAALTVRVATWLRTKRPRPAARRLLRNREPLSSDLARQVLGTYRRTDPSDALIILDYRSPMTWGTIAPAIITAAAAFLGVGYGARLSTRRETLNWTREQRLKAYAELLNAIEKCYDAFELIAAALNLANYDEAARQDPKVINTATEWGTWDSEIDRYLPQAELTCSLEMQPYITYIRLGMRSRQRVLLMQLSYGQEINKKA